MRLGLLEEEMKGRGRYNYVEKDMTIKPLDDMMQVIPLKNL